MENSGVGRPLKFILQVHPKFMCSSWLLAMSLNRWLTGNSQIKVVKSFIMVPETHTQSLKTQGFND